MIAHHLSFYFFAKQGVGVTAEVKNGSDFLDLTFEHLIFVEKMAKMFLVFDLVNDFHGFGLVLN